MAKCGCMCVFMVCVKRRAVVCVLCMQECHVSLRACVCVCVCVSPPLPATAAYSLGLDSTVSSAARELALLIAPSPLFLRITFRVTFISDSWRECVWVCGW